LNSIGRLNFFLHNVQLAIFTIIINNCKQSFDAYVFPEKVYIDISKSSLETLNKNTFEILPTPYFVFFVQELKPKGLVLCSFPD